MDTNMFMQTAVKHPGAFTKKAKEAGMPVHEFAKHVMANKAQHDNHTIEQANLALTFEKSAAKMKKKNTHKHPTVSHIKAMLAAH